MQAAQVAGANWSAEVRGCGLTNSAHDCLIALGDAARSSKDFPAFIDALANGGILCHEAAHETSAKAIAAGEDPVAWLSLVAQRDVCLGGLLHGVFDNYIPATISNEAAVRDIMEVCETLSGLFASTCADGAGHGIYQATHDTDAAIDMCLWFTSDSLRGSCVGGVVMQMFRPEADGSRPADYPLSKADTAGVRFCDEVAEKSGQSVGEMCMYGLSHPYTEELDAKTRLAVADEGGNLEDIAGEWLDKVDGCAAFGQWENSCRDIVGERLGYSTMSVPSSRDVLCAPKELRQRCTSVAPLVAAS